MRKQVEGWQKKEVTDVTVKLVIHEPFVEGELERRSIWLGTSNESDNHPRCKNVIA